MPLRVLLSLRIGHKIQPGCPGAGWRFRYFSGSSPRFRWCVGTLRQKRVEGIACKVAGASIVLDTFPALLGIAGALFADLRCFLTTAPQELLQH